jgi:hypothetical protein
VAFPVEAIADILFGNQQKDRLQGLEIWTDDSESRREILRIQVVPQNIQFAQRARISEQTIKDGRAFFFWRKDRRSNHLDLLEIQLSGITRSLAKEKRQGGAGILSQLGQAARDATSLVVPAVGNPAPLDDQPTPKQREWIRLWRITREPFVAEDHINHHHIRLNTPAFPGLSPQGVEFIGHFAAPIQFSEVADNPFLVQWNLSFIVHRTVPELDQFFELINQFTVTGG